MRERASEVAGPTFGAGGLARDVPYGMSQLCDGVVRGEAAVPARRRWR
ncbi:hypothetical protein J2S71_000880 [Olsenella profusa DSM 13989]|nr:hypothetical protein [Olsenella profusa DSM 13989]